MIMEKDNIIEFSDLQVDATINNFSIVKNWLRSIFDKIDCQEKPSRQLFIAADEIYTNISNYAYQDIGKVAMHASFNKEDNALTLTFKDNGIEYNPLLKPDPDIAKRVKEQTIGGLGIFMAKKMVDTIEYSRLNNENVLVLTKKIK